MEPGAERVRAEPLTRVTRAGVRYRRPAAVEAQLAEVLALRMPALIARAQITDRASPAYLKDECLVYLVRAAGLGDDADRFNTLTSLLLRRCTPAIRQALAGLGVAPDDLADVTGELIEAMLTAILAPDGRGDFYQVRFRKALKYQLLNVYERYARRRRRADRQDSLSTPVGGGTDGDDLALLEEFIGSREELAEDVERRMLIREALSAIVNPRHREAFVLHYLEDWQIEALDPSTPCISRHFGVTPKTVYNWLQAAHADLAAWRDRRSA